MVHTKIKWEMASGVADSDSVMKCTYAWDYHIMSNHDRPYPGEIHEPHSVCCQSWVKERAVRRQSLSEPIGQTPPALRQPAGYLATRSFGSLDGLRALSILGVMWLHFDRLGTSLGDSSAWLSRS